MTPLVQYNYIFLEKGCMFWIKYSNITLSAGLNSNLSPYLAWRWIQLKPVSSLMMMMDSGSVCISSDDIFSLPAFSLMMDDLIRNM
jgi:hypothetical protein